MLSVGCERYAPIAPGPIDSSRRRQLPVVVKRVQSTLPIKTRLTNKIQLNNKITLSK